jgi:hypothetical protein
MVEPSANGPKRRVRARAVSKHRHAGLESTYIISCVPDFVQEHAPAKL